MGSQVEKLARDSGIAYTSATGKAACSCAKTSVWLHWWMPLGLWRRFSWRARGDFSVLLGSSERADRRTHSKLSAWRVQISSTPMRLWRSMSQFCKIQQTSNRSTSRNGDATISQKRESLRSKWSILTARCSLPVPSVVRYSECGKAVQRLQLASLLPSAIEVWTWCWMRRQLSKAKYDELQKKASSLHSTSSARWMQEAFDTSADWSPYLFIFINILPSLVQKLKNRLSFIIFLSFITSSLQRLKVYWTSSSSHFFFFFQLYSMVYSLHMLQSDLFFITLCQVDWSHTVQPSKSFHFLLEWIIAFAIVCEKNDHRYPIFSFLWAREQSTKNAEEYWTGSRKNREVPAGQIDVNNKHHKSKLGFIKHFVKVRQVSQWNCFVENSRNMNAEKAHKGKLYTTVWFVFALLVCLILYTSWTLDDCPEKWCICGLRHSSTKV